MAAASSATLAPPYSIGGFYPRELKDALSGFPCVVKDEFAALELKFEQPAVLTGVKVHGMSFVEVRAAEDSCKRRMLSRLVFIHVNHRCPHTTHHDRQKGRSFWSGRIEFQAGQSQHILFTPYTLESECKVVGAFMEIRDISFTVQSTETALSNQLATLFDNRVMLGVADDEVEVQLSGTEPEATSSLFVSKFVLQLRSPVFRAELRGGAFTEGRSRQLRFPDFPDSAVRCFMEVLHRDRYTGSPTPDELVAMFALGDKYDVPLVQEMVYNKLSELELSPAELRRAMDSIRRYRAQPLRKSLLKKIRQLGDDELCGLLYGDAEESRGSEEGLSSQACAPHP